MLSLGYDDVVFGIKNSLLKSISAINRFLCRLNQTFNDLVTVTPGLVLNVSAFLIPINRGHPETLFLK